MSATHTYVINVSQADIPNDLTLIQGTVDNIPATGIVQVTINPPYSQLLSAFTTGGLPALKALVFSQMLEQAKANGLASVKSQITQLPTGTFTA